jgi:hypothetical protein
VEKDSYFGKENWIWRSVQERRSLLSSLLRSKAGACPGVEKEDPGVEKEDPGVGKEDWEELEEIKGRGPRECVFVLHRFCTDLEEYYLSVAKAKTSTSLLTSLISYYRTCSKRHGREP